MVSSTGTADADFTNPFSAGDLLSNQDTSFKAFELPSPAKGVKYVKIIGNGQLENTSTRYTSIHEIEFYKTDSSLSIKENQTNNQVKMYPNPVRNIVTLSQLKNQIDTIQIFALDGRKVMEKPIKTVESEINIDVSTLSNGSYIMNIKNDDASKQPKIFVFSH